ncbi:dynein heavy chain 7, axonemal-like [Chelonus insularis]|uniref:dynein heavy chain 7, axonemal-like n=1 Tax=Chelonus insularis TaxID=460826 RepID=UPI00158AD129|nr:dynein heavy chain 7, axonemal-like [Chelonus insularis]
MANDWRKESTSQKSLKNTLKRPSTDLSNIFDVKIESLLPLPEDLIAPCLSKRKKSQRSQRKYQFPYSNERQRKEKFRKFLIELLNPQEDEQEDEKEKDIAGVDSQYITQYYNYIKSGVDTLHVVPLDATFTEKITQIIPLKLRNKFQRHFEELIKEVKEDHIVAVKKSIIDFIFLDTSDDINDQDHQNIFEELLAFRSPKAYHRELQNIFYLPNPSMRTILERWIRDWKSFRLIDLGFIEANQNSWNHIEFNNTICTQIKERKKILKATWFGNIQNIFLINDRKRLIPSPLQQKTFQGFFNCANKLMENQLREMCEDTLRNFVEFIFQNTHITIMEMN